MLAIQGIAISTPVLLLLRARWRNVWRVRPRRSCATEAADGRLSFATYRIADPGRGARVSYSQNPEASSCRVRNVAGANKNQMAVGPHAG
jgi:hypothetical protein